MDSARALRASIVLFARLGRRIADGLGFRSFNHESIHREIDVILAMRPDARYGFPLAGTEPTSSMTSRLV